MKILESTYLTLGIELQILYLGFYATLYCRFCSRVLRLFCIADLVSGSEEKAIIFMAFFNMFLGGFEQWDKCR